MAAINKQKKFLNNILKTIKYLQVNLIHDIMDFNNEKQYMLLRKIK